VIQRNLLKAKTFFNKSVAKVRDVNLSQKFIDSIREIPQRGKKISQSQPPAWILFTREILRTPRTMGTGFPSSRRLAKAMASFVPLTKSKLVVELGSGTGVVTKALLQHGVAPERLVSIEQSANLADYLHKKYPQVRIIEGDAMQLCHLLGDDYQQVSAVVSGLPFRVLPQTVKQSIIKQIEKVLPQNGLLIQFTYDISGKTKLLPSQFKQVSHKTVWSNIPPARVDVYRLER
jgi:phosphatidylethanolamine/phosphatidyl-N-methylethanolamine N-methyltransferase